jgi:hypothetical protein
MGYDLSACGTGLTRLAEHYTELAIAAFAIAYMN